MCEWGSVREDGMAEHAAKPADCADLQHWCRPKTHLLVAFAKQSIVGVTADRATESRQTVKHWLQTVHKHQGHRQQNSRHTYMQKSCRQTEKLLENVRSKLRAQSSGLRPFHL